MNSKPRLTQFACSITDQLGGPSRVVKETHEVLKNFFENDLIVIGQGKVDTASFIAPALFNNRYGLPKRIIGNSISHLQNCHNCCHWAHQNLHLEVE